MEIFVIVVLAILLFVKQVQVWDLKKTLADERHLHDMQTKYELEHPEKK